ncbi:di-trans,poly-cis-decaprenylcistransferase [Streptomyces xiamenensis]|uniref:Di-trans,poly-cis-decaprenylcistransferase n=1 Tax=Streptomyces xiamenensis TaxID=408015 RepID=A0A0F7FR65_9ACTN|nr:undecaprenyl diphosphate synthase family protein [Streptomyces xiamenensis]AKG41953.1 di-trans,poly-cis-decaprenylcistransferase [Streptomyces xiamenensis]
MNATAPHTDSPPRIPAGLLPRRVAVAMDGNGRWARERGLPRSEGHRAGAGRLPELARAALEVGVEQVLVYGFSTENWRRSPQEVSGLMRIAGQVLAVSERSRLARDVWHGTSLRCRGIRVAHYEEAPPPCDAPHQTPRA